MKERVRINHTAGTIITVLLSVISIAVVVLAIQDYKRLRATEQSRFIDLPTPVETEEVTIDEGYASVEVVDVDLNDIFDDEETDYNFTDLSDEEYTVLRELGVFYDAEKGKWRRAVLIE